MSPLDAIRAFTRRLKTRLTLPVNTQGHMLAMKEGAFSPTPTLVSAGIIDSDEELSLMQEYKESFEVVFNQWQRFSRSSGHGYGTESKPGEMQAWSYQSATDQLRCTINSTTYIGFISNKRYSRYTLETRLKSSNGDDDWIGLCAAVAVDADGNTHTLDVLRALNGQAPMIVSKNYSVDNDHLALVYNGLKWSDGTVATGSVPGNVRPGWNAFPNGILLKITREDDIITIETSQLNETGYFEPAKTVLDLSQDPRLTVFRGACAYGYSCRSQNNSTWDVLQRSGDRIPVVDIRTFKRHEFVNNQWVVTQTNMAELIDSGELVREWLHYNAVTGRHHYLTKTGELKAL